MRAGGVGAGGGGGAGVVCGGEGLEETAEAVRGVVLASGGFGANAEMRRKYIPQADAGCSLQPEGSQGDGVTMGVSVGGNINEGNAANALWVPASAMTRDNRQPVVSGKRM